MAPFALLNGVIRIAVQRSWKCDLRSVLVGRDVLSTLALVFFAYLPLNRASPFEHHAMARSGVVRLTYRDRRRPKQDARSHCCHCIPPFARRFGSKDPQR